MEQFESLNFHTPDNDLWRAHHRSMKKREWIMRSLSRWVLSAMIGLAVGFTASAIRYGSEAIADWKFELVQENIDSHGGIIAFFIYTAINVVFASLAYGFVHFFGPKVASSGIPEVMGYLNGVRVPAAFNVRTYFAKVASLICAYSSSMALGPEGPLIHLGALIGSAIGPVKSKTLNIYSNFSWRFGTDKDKRDFISSGAAAGISAAFGAPMGGVLYALEEATSFWSRELTWRTFFCCMVSAFLVNAILQARAGTQKVTDYGVLTFGFSTSYLYRYLELVPFAIVAVGGGIIGAAFNHVNISINKWRAKKLHTGTRVVMFVEVLVVVTVTSLICFTAPTAFSCTPITNFHLNSTDDVCDRQSEVTLRQMFCEEGEYSEMGSLLWSTPSAALPLLYSRATDLFSMHSLIFFGIIYFFLAAITSGISVAGGLFVPMMLVGASLGRAAGIVVRMTQPNLVPPIDPSVYALLGSAAVMTGFCRMTISLVVILVELTEGTQYLLPIILVVMISKWVADSINYSVYESLVFLKGIPFLHSPHKSCHKLTAKDVMNPNVVCFTEIEAVPQIMKILKDVKHNAFPVLNAEKQFMGMITRGQLIFLITQRIFVPSEPSHRYLSAHSSLTYRQFAEFLQRKLPLVPNIQLSEDDLLMSVDLRPYMHKSAVLIPSTCSFMEAFEIFRTLGLRHLPVLNEKHEPVGMITRKDLV